MIPPPTAPGPAFNDGDDIFAHIVRHGRALIAPVEIAGWLNVTDRHIRNLADEGVLEKHTLGAMGKTLRITRRSLICFLLRSANYKPGDEEQYLILIKLLMTDLSDLGLKKVEWNCHQFLAAREHTRAFHRSKLAPPTDLPPELPL